MGWGCVHDGDGDAAFADPGGAPAGEPELLWELPFWLCLLYGSLVPATMVTRREWFGVPMRYSDLFTLLSAIYYGCVLGMQVLMHRRIATAKGPLLATLGLLAFGGLTLAMGPLESEDKLAMGFTLLLAASGRAGGGHPEHLQPGGN